jgi:hypothetical protein
MAGEGRGGVGSWWLKRVGGVGGWGGGMGEARKRRRWGRWKWNLQALVRPRSAR